MIEQNFIDVHFISNPDWREVYLKHFPNYTPEDYMDNAIKLFELNGYTITTERMGKSKSSQYYKVMRANLHSKEAVSKDNDDGFLFGTDWRHESAAVSNLIITAICEYEVDISKFK